MGYENEANEKTQSFELFLDFWRCGRLKQQLLFILSSHIHTGPQLNPFSTAGLYPNVFG